MKRSFLLTALAVATLSVNVLAIQAQAGTTTGLKPSANQGTQSTTDATNKDVSSIVYDTGKYQYPAQQLIAENRQFDKYDWRLFQRFDNHELMYNEWAEAMNFHADEYSANVFHDNPDGTKSRFFDFRESSLKYFEIEWLGSSGKKIFIADNDLRFKRNDTVNTYIPISLAINVYTKPENCWPFSGHITIPGSHDHNWNINPIGFYQETFWHNVQNGTLTPEESALYDAQYGKTVDPVKLYYPSRPIYVSGWCLTDMAQNIKLINSCFKDEDPENCSAYVYEVHRMFQSMSSMKKLN